MRPAHRPMVRCSGVAFAALVLLACGGPSSPSAAPDVRGTYTGQSPWTTSMISPGRGPSQTISNYLCGGSLTIDSQSGSAFSGRFQVEGSSRCAASGSLVNGVANADGSVSFELPGPAGGPHPGTDQWSEHCWLESDSGASKGRVNGADLKASRSLRYTCPNAGLVSVSVTFRGQR
jgi:hypothetical protein